MLCHFSYNHLSYKSFFLHTICPTHHFSYTSFVLQDGENFICPSHHLSYTSFVLHIICPKHNSSYTSFVLHFICTLHYVSYSEGIKLFFSNVQKLNLISFNMLNNMLSSRFILGKISFRQFMSRSVRLGWATRPSAAVS